MKFRREYRDPRPGEVAAFLSANAKWVRQHQLSHGTELRFRPCPKCGHDKSDNPAGQINATTGLWRCFACDAVGNWFTLTREFGNPLPENDRWKNDRNQINPKLYEHLRKQPRRPVADGHYPELLAYCHQRRIGNDTLNAWKVSTRGDAALRFPIYAWINDTWEIVNARIRVCIDPNAKVRDYFEIKGGPTRLLLGNHLIDANGPKRAILFEGQWDVMTAYELGITNVFSIPNGANNIHVADMLQYIPDDWEIWLAMDNDAAGQKAIEKFFAQLGPDRVARLKLPTKDLNDWAVSNHSLTASDVLNTVCGVTTMISMTGTTPEMFLGIKMDESVDETNAPIAFSPWKKLNHLLAGGFRAGETTGVLAPSGVGKTTWCNHVAVFNASESTKVGLISLEGTREALKRKIRDAVRGVCSPDKYQQTLNHLMISNLESTATTWTECIDEFKIMIGNGAKLLILDNLDFITRDNQSDKLRSYAAIVGLAREHNVHVIVVWQPNKVDRNACVNSGNQKGYSQTFQDSDNYINLNVIDDFTRLEVEKSREQGVRRIDNKCWFVYDKKTRTFAECEVQKDLTDKKNSVGIPTVDTGTF